MIMKKLSILFALMLAVVLCFTAIGCGFSDSENDKKDVERADSGNIGYLFTEYEGFY